MTSYTTLVSVNYRAWFVQRSVLCKGSSVTSVGYGASTLEERDGTLGMKWISSGRLSGKEAVKCKSERNVLVCSTFSARAG